MKKILLSAAMFAASVFAFNAQGQQESYKPEAGSVAIEVGISPLLGLVYPQAGIGNVDDQMGGQLKISYSVSDNIGIRLGLEFGTISSSYDNGLAGNNSITVNGSYFVFSISPGLTYSFAGTERLTPYVGAELQIGTISNSYEFVQGNNKVTLKNDNEENDMFTAFGGNVFTGFNYYFAKNLFVGAEVGLGLRYVSLKNREETINGNKNTLEDSVSAFGFGFYCNPAIRLGWAF